EPVHTCCVFASSTETFTREGTANMIGANGPSFTAPERVAPSQTVFALTSGPGLARGRVTVTVTVSRRRAALLRRATLNVRRAVATTMLRYRGESATLPSCALVTRT